MSHNPTLTHYHLPRMKEMGRLYWCNSIGALGASLTAIFVPVFLLKSGYSLQSVLVFLLLQQLFAAMLQYPISKLFEYINPHFLIGLGRLSYGVFFWLLLTLPGYGWPLEFIAVFWAIDRTMYWAGLHYAFGLARAHEHSGRQVANINALAILATTAAPAIGGLIATMFDIKYVYITTILLIIASIFPLIMARRSLARSKLKITPKIIWKVRHNALANSINGMILVAEQSIWPIFISLIVISYAGIGILSSVIAAASVAVMIYVGRKEEINGEQYYIKKGMVIYGLTSAGRALAQNSLHIFGLNLSGGIGRALYVTPFMNRYYANSDGKNRLGYITIMETSFSVGASVYLLCLIGLLTIFSAEAVLSIGLAALAFLAVGLRLMR